jgi:hypothetical protein
MKKLASLAAVAAVAILSSVSLATPSSAHSAGPAVAAGVLGLGLGIMAGAAMAGGPHYIYHDSDYGRWRDYGGRWGYSDWRWRRHIRDCFATYPTYDPRTDSWVDRYGHWHRCRL